MRLGLGAAPTGLRNLARTTLPAVLRSALGATLKATPAVALAATLLILPGKPAHALETLTITLSERDDDALYQQLRNASVLRATRRDGQTDPQDLLAAALSDYTRLLETLYANGFYSGRISIRIDGREAALIPPLETPGNIDTIAVTVTPGRVFRFGTAEITPLAPGATPLETFRSGARARATVVGEAVAEAQDDWRAAGHALVRLEGQRITADHARQRLDARITLAPGPQVRFGALQVTPGSAVRPSRIRRIAGLPEGEVYSPDDLARASQRLRRSGAFRSVTLAEAETLGRGNSMDITATVVDERPRRLGFGAELSSLDGVRLTAFWLHRNLLGGAERFRVDGEIKDIGAQNSGIDYRLGARLDRPALWGADTSLWLTADLERLDEPTFRTDRAALGIGAHRIINDQLSADLGLGLSRERTRDAFGARTLTMVTLPVSLTWDRRDDLLNPASGTYLRAEATPFVGIAGVDNGARLRGDLRAYRALDADARYVAAARLQWGALYGASLDEAPPGYLFTSGGGGTVRGQPYQSLGVPQGGGRISGGRGFAGASAELRAKVWNAISLVGFADAGFISADPGFSADGAWHSGAGIGLRYDTVVGPIRLDVAGPVSGDTGKGVQLYIGIGQAF